MRGRNTEETRKITKKKRCHPRERQRFIVTYWHAINNNRMGCVTGPAGRD